MSIATRTHKRQPRARWTADATNYYASDDAPADMVHRTPASAPRHHAFDGMSLAEIDAWLTRGDMAREGTQAAQRATYTWHKRDDGSYRAVVLYWGKWDVARSWHCDSVHPRGLWSILCARGVIHRSLWTDGDAYATFLMVGRVEQVPTS